MNQNIKQDINEEGIKLNQRKKKKKNRNNNHSNHIFFLDDNSIRRICVKQ